MTAAAVADVARRAQISLEFKGGEKLQRTLKRMQTGLGTAKGVSVGFLSDKRYPTTYSTRVDHRISPNRKPLHVAQVAFWQQFGTKRIPARPYFTTMIEENSPRWGDSLAHLAKVHNYDARKMMTNMGIGIQAQLVRSIRDWSTPPNAQLTVDIKGFNNPLIDEGIMMNSVEYEVTNKL
jgi:hypothetical protein